MPPQCLLTTIRLRSRPQPDESPQQSDHRSCHIVVQSNGTLSFSKTNSQSGAARHTSPRRGFGTLRNSLSVKSLSRLRCLPSRWSTSNSRSGSRRKAPPPPPAIVTAHAAGLVRLTGKDHNPHRTAGHIKVDKADSNGQTPLVWSTETEPHDETYVSPAFRIETGMQSAPGPHRRVAIQPYIGENTAGLDLVVGSVTIIDAVGTS